MTAIETTTAYKWLNSFDNVGAQQQIAGSIPSKNMFKEKKSSFKIKQEALSLHNVPKEKDVPTVFFLEL